MEGQRPGGATGSAERLAACTARDAPFDTGMITVNVGLRIHLSDTLADAVRGDPLARQFYGRTPLRERLLVPEAAQPPARTALTGHCRSA